MVKKINHPSDTNSLGFDFYFPSPYLRLEPILDRFSAYNDQADYDSFGNNCNAFTHSILQAIPFSLSLFEDNFPNILGWLDSEYFDTDQE